MNRSVAAAAVLAAGVSCLCSALPVRAQIVGDSFADSAASQFSIPNSIYANPMRLPWRPYATYHPSRAVIKRGGSWLVQYDGSVIFIPRDDAAEAVGDSFTGFEDEQPPSKTTEKHGMNQDGDEFSKPAEDSPDPIGSRYSKTARRWSKQRMPLRVYISKVVDYARGGSVQSEIVHCLNEWSTALHGEFSYHLVSDFRNADILFLQHDTEDHTWAENERAYSRSKQGLDEVRIFMQKQAVSYLPMPRLRAVLLHETGHALGLIDHLSDPSDAMALTSCDVNKPVTQLSDDDKFEIEKLYATDALANQNALKEAPYKRLPERNKIADRSH